MHSAAGAEAYVLRKLALADSEAKAAALPNEIGGAVTVVSPDYPFFESTEFRSMIEPLLGKTIDQTLLNTLIQTIATYARKEDRLVAQVLIPNQNVAQGTLRFGVIMRRYGELSFQGNRWFSQKLLEERLGIKRGDEVRLSTLEAATGWLNTNPFRQIQVMVNDIPNQPSQANLIVAVQERMPYRAAFSYDDSGNVITGKHRYAAIFQFGNLWGRDHQGSYQFLTSNLPRVYQGHALDYRIPLESRHFIQLRTHYISTKAVFNNGLLAQDGKTFLANVKYTVPLSVGNQPSEFSFGADYKRSNNTLDFVGYGLARADNNDTFQLNAGYSRVKRDKKGVWMVGLNLNASPGNISSRNTTESLEQSRSAAKATYVYGTLSLQRLQALYKGWELFVRGTAQAASNNMLASEQLAIGGSATVRGYNENIYAGEKGYILNHELMTPFWRPRLPFLPKNSPPLETRFLGFLDVAKVDYRKRFGSDILFAPLASTGMGIRTSLATNLNATFDYGWQLTHQAQQAGQAQRLPLSSRGHIKVVLAF